MTEAATPEDDAMHGRSPLLILVSLLAVGWADPDEARAASPALNPALAAQAPGTDLYALALEHLEPARDGQVESQWVLRAVLQECAAHLKRFPTPDALTAQERSHARPGTRGYERLLDYQNRMRSSAESRCRGFRGDTLERFGAASDWYARALEAQHPLALLERAIETTKGHKGGAFPAETHELMRQALRSGRTDVIWSFAIWDLERALGLDERRARGPQPLAWLLLACERGFHCASDSQWLIPREVEPIPRDVHLWLSAQTSEEFLARGSAEATRLGLLIDARRWDEVFASLYL